ncbi:MAG: LysR family transcriptional regulator [Alphaproteobacteria bacterium]|nr:LysR family transcriptional regulator [Alphaproteobacteria bacterium]
MDIDWDDHRYFLAIARERSLTAAGKALGVSQPTVSRRLDALEAKLKVRLFDRTHQGYELTAVGMDLFDTVAQVEEDLAQAGRKIYGKDQELTGGLRITCTEILLNGYLSEHIWPFLEQNPGIEMSVFSTRAPLSLSRNDADLALRFTNKPPETLAGRRLAAATYSVYTSSGEAGARFTPSSRSGWDWIGLPDDTYNQLFIGAVEPEGRIKHRADSMAAIQSMARQGLGAAVLPCYVADRDPGLRRAEPETLLDLKLDLWLLYHPDVRRVYRVRLFAEFMVNLILSDLDLFEGRRPFQVN